MSMPRSQYQSYGKRGSHHNRGHSMPSHSHHHHHHLQRAASLPQQQPVVVPVAVSVPASPVAETAAPIPQQILTPSTSANELSPQSSSNYEQVVRYVRDRWLSVKHDLNHPPDDPSRRVAYYVETEPNPRLKDFVPFDLEAFCERQRLKREKKQQQPPPPQ